ncbi:Cna B-type domain-containing protein [Bacillota bacterium HCP3S3_E9]
MKNRAFRKFVASIGVAVMVMSTATNALSPAVTRAESAQELEGQQNDSQEQGGQEDPVAQSSDDTNGAPFADAEPMAVSSEDSQDSQEAAGPSESSDSNGENGPEGSSGENMDASAGSTSAEASGAGSQDATGTMSGVTNGTVGTTNSTITGTTGNSETINGATDTSANGTSTDASAGTTTGENGEASGDNAEASTKEITSVITEDIDLGTYFAGDAPAYAQLELPDEIEVKVDEEKQTVTVTWNGEETYHPDQAGTYIFSSELDKEWNKDENGNARYQLAEKVELPKASVRVEKKAESTEDSKAEVKSDNKMENKTDAKLDIKEDNKTDAKADNKSEGKTEEKSDNKSEVTTKPETTKETTKDTSKENTKETSKKDSASKDKTKDETKNETKGEAKNEAREENKTDTKDETTKADQKKKVTNAASLKAVYVAEDGTVLCGTVGLTGDSFTISDKAKSFNGYELKTVTLGEEELPQDTAFTRNTSTTETKEEIRTEASYTYTMDGAEHEIAAGDTATITFTYAQKEEVTPEIASIEVTGEAVDTTGAAIQGDYAFPLAVGTNDLSKTAPYIQGYEYQYAEIGTDKITSIDKEVLEAGKYAYYVDGELLKENTKITYVYQEDEDYTEQLSADCGDVSVTLSATKDAKIPKNAKLVVNAITGDRLRSALSMSADAMGVTADKVYGTAYDIYLEADGNRIQPSEHVHVTMSFHNPVSLNLPDKAQVAKSAVIHIHDGSASEVSGTAGTDGSSVTGAEFDADSFSIYVNAYMVNLAAEREKTNPIDLANALKNVTVSKINGEIYDSSKTYPRDANIEFLMRYKFAEENKPKADGVRTATYSLPEGLDVQDTTGIISCEGYTAGYAGTYTIKDGVVTFEYTEDFLKAHPNNIEGTFTFSSSLSKEATNNKDNVKIEFPGNGTTIPITVNLEGGNITGGKSYQLNDDGSIDFTITLTVTGKDVENVKLSDVQGSNLAFADDPQFKLDGNLIDASKITQNENTADLALGKLSIGEHKLTYKAKLQDTSIVSGDPNKNTATWSWNGNQGSADTWVSATKKSLKKTGNADKNSKEITWTVIYVPGSFNSAAGKTFKDTLEQDQKYIGNYEVYYDPSGNEHWVGGNRIATGPMPEGNSFTYTFSNDQKATTGAYRITYKTQITKDLTDSTSKEIFKNSASIDEENASGSAEIDNTPQKPDIVKKSGKANGEDRTATWTVTITPPAGKTLKNLVAVDELQNSNEWKGKYKEATITVKEGNTKLEKNTDYTISFGKNNNNNNPTMTVDFKKEIHDTVTVTYTADYKDSSITGWTNNKIHTSYTIDETKSEDDEGRVEFKQQVQVPVAKSGSLSGGVATWKICINDITDWKRGEIKNGVLDNIVDTIPAGMEYVDGSLKCRIDASHWGDNNTTAYEDVSAKFDETSRKLSISINNLNLSDPCIYVELEYKTKITKIPEESGDGTNVGSDKITFENKVNVGGKDYSGQVEMSSKELDKKGKQVEGLSNVIEYSITVNSSAAALNPEKDTLELTDVLDTNLILDTTSIKVKDMTGETVHYQSSFGTTADGKNTIRLILPDSKALVVTYRASLVSAGKENEKSYQVSNSATLIGAKTKTVEQTTSVKYESTGATVAGNQNSIVIKKVDENGKVLPGAEFAVQEVNPVDLSTKGESIAIRSKDGSAKFENLQLNTLYYYQETEAPTGYQGDMDRKYFVIQSLKNDGEKNAFNTLISSIKEGTKYAVISGGNTFLLENQKIKIEVSGTKTWVDGGKSHTNAREVKLTLTRTSKNVTETVAATPEWDGNTYKYQNLDQYDSKGAAYTYHVSEEKIPGYTTSQEGNNFTNTISGTTEVEGTKTWVDDGAEHDNASEITITLSRKSKKEGAKEEIVADATPSWTGDTYKFENLPKYDSEGYEYEYTVSETKLPEGYTSSQEGNKFTNTKTGKTEVVGTKTWVDGGKSHTNAREVKLTLTRTSKNVTETVAATPEWDGNTYKYQNLDQYDSKGAAYTYHVSEEKIPGYTTSQEGNNFTNTRTGKTTILVSKSWSDDNNRDNKRPASITVNLFADGTKVASQKIMAANDWKYQFTDLPKYKDGKEIKYTITEDPVEGYTSSIDGFHITNTYTPEKVQVSGSKNWNDDGNAAGTRPGSITIRLYANGSEIDHKTVTEKDGWSWNWTGLNRYDTDHKEISYTISEDAVDGYTSSISGYNVTNTVNKPQVGSVILTKVDATTGTALAGAVFDLYRANNTKVGTYTTNAGGVLRVDGLTFGDYYFVETKAPEGYALESQRAAFTINAATTVSAPASVRVTNKPVDEKIGVSAAKVWDDENNTDGVRPSSVTFRLFADGVEIGSARASEANGWTVSFGNLPKTRNGAAISYAVKEDEVGNYYEASYETGLGSDGSYVFTVKNYRETDKHYEERTGSVRGANRNKPSNGGVAGAGRGRGTGDESDMTVYGTVSGASLLALIVWMIARRKRAGKGTK